MSGSVGKLLRNETGFSRRVVCGGALALAAGCSIDNRNVQNTPGGGSGSPGALAETSSSGADLPAAAGSGAGEGSSASGGAAGNGPGGEPPAPAAPAFVDTSSGSAGLPGAAGAAGVCQASSQRCQGGALQVCNDAGMWAPLGTSCGECVPDASECAGSTLRVCSSTGVWIDRLQCAGSQPVCQAASGSCVCNESSCPLGQLCSAETFSCVEQLSDCPVPSPIPISEDIDHGFVSVRFDAATGSADVRIQNIGTGIVFFSGVVCNGADNCVVLRDGVTIQLNARDTLDVTIPNTRPEGGELALLDNYPDEAITGFAYVAWGTGPVSSQLETLANTDWPNWRPGERIQLAPGDSGFVSTGNSNEAAGYTSCNPARSAP